jgi:CRP/FNR family transcriptional regulator
MLPNVADILQGCELFAEVQPREFARLVTIAQLKRFRKGETIFREGVPCPGVYVVGSGMVRVYKTGRGGKEHVLHLVEPGGTFAEVAAIGDFACPASAQAIAPSLCALLPLGRFRQLLDEDHALCRELLLGLTLWVRRLVGTVEDVVFRDAAGRLARYLLDAPTDREGLVRLPGLKRHVASHLNLTSETFSRTVRRLADQGLIAEPAKNRVQILNRLRLQKIAHGISREEGGASP